MAIVVVSFVEQSLLQKNSPSAALIQLALLAVGPVSNGVSAGWVGPTPRITRTGTLAADETVYVTWLYRIPNKDSFDMGRLHDNVTRALRIAEPSGIESDYRFGPVSITDYSEELNGPIESWESGLAASTQTRDRPMTFAQGQFVPPEDPVKAPSSVGLGARRALTTILLPLGIAIPVIGFFYWLSRSQFQFSTDTARVAETFTKPLRAPKALPAPAYRVTAEDRRVEQEIEERKHVLSVKRRKDFERQAAEAKKQADRKAAGERLAKKKAEEEVPREAPERHAAPRVVGFKSSGDRW